jgi:ABC-type sugar transport system ATPase subunit
MSFGSARVLEDVDFELRAGEVHVLAGGNGAGKSTLIKILSGVHRGYGGHVRVAPQAGRVSVIHQELSLVDSLSVLDNIFLGRELGEVWLDHRAQRRKAEKLCADIGLAVDLDRAVEDYPLAVKNQIEIVKALAVESRAFIMDEPTSALTEPEVERLFAVIAMLKRSGCGIVYISHKMEEIYRLADRITVLRDGRVVASGVPARELPREELIRRMVGGELASAGVNTRPAGSAKRLVAEVDGVRIQVGAGEVLGLAGLQGSGNSELLHALFGARGPRKVARALIDGRPHSIISPARSISSGVALCAGDRRGQGLVLGMSIRENVTLASLPKISRRGLVDGGREKAIAKAHASRLRVRATSIEQETGTLSGGNQQKVMLAKWIETRPKVLLLEEPTRGVDVGAKEEIYDLIEELAAAGIAIVLVTSETPELLRLADRVAVMHRGRITAEYSRAEASPEKVMRAAMGEVA